MIDKDMEWVRISSLKLTAAEDAHEMITELLWIFNRSPCPTSVITNLLNGSHVLDFFFFSPIIDLYINVIFSHFQE